MQVKVDGKRNITLDFEAPKKFKLLQDGKEIPYLRTGKNSFRLLRNIDGVLDLEKIIEQPKIVKPMQLQAQQMALVNPNDVLMINQAAQQLEVEQNILGETQKRVEQTQAYLDVQQQRINETVLSVQGLETNNAERISATENGLFNLAGNLASTEQNLIDSIGIVNNGLQEHKNAENPHKITKKTIGLDKVDNTADIDKPISKAVKNALDEKADKDEIQAIREELGEYQEKNERFTNALSNYTGGLAGNQLPDGGLTGQVLGKRSDISGDVDWIDSSASITVDDELSLTSENPVQNKVITNKINSEVANLTTRVGNLETGKQDKLTQVQLDAINSGATTANIAKISTNETAINNHIANTSNPHSVTKSQVGLGNVDNTSDLNKPISTATQTALNSKQDVLTAGTDLEIVSISHNLPAEYQELRYIQGVSDTQYIDTGIVPTSSMNMYGKFMMVNRGASNVALFGARDSVAFSGVYAWSTTSQVKAQWFLTADDQRLTINDSAQTFNTYEYYFENNACSIKKNGRRIGYKAFTPQGSVTQTLYVNALNNNNSVGSNNGATVRIYRFTIWNECDLIPARRISDSKVGMYDIIRNQFLTNAGSDDFTAGPNIIGSGIEINFTNDSGYITDITSSDVTTALGYTPYDTSNPAGYTSNVGTVTSVNNVAPVNGNVSLSIPTVNNATLTIQKNGTNVATFTANASSNVTANIGVPNTVSSVSSSSTNADAVGAKLFYDTCGDIEALINAL